MRIKFYIIFALATILYACQETSEIVSPTVAPGTGIDNTAYVNVPDMPLVDELDGEIGTRSALTWTDMIRFQWQEGDALLIFSSDNQTAQSNSTSYSVYKLMDNGIKDDKRAAFNGDGFTLTLNKTYYAFASYYEGNPTVQDVAKPLTFIGKDNITLSYEGQKQVGNASDALFGKYDYLAAYAKVTEQGYANFNFAHLGCPICFRIEVKEHSTFKKFEIRRADNKPISYIRYLDLTNDGDLEHYPPKLGKPDDEDVENDEFAMDLYNESGELGIEMEPSTTDVFDTYLVLYMMIPATSELNGVPMYGILTDMDEKKHYISYVGKDYVAGNGTRYKRTETSSGVLNLTLAVKKRWQQGDTQDITRAVGDPGYDEDLVVPKYVYVYTCLGDNVIKDQTKKLVTTDEDWNYNATDAVWTLKNSLGISYGVESGTLTSYVFASDRDLDSYLGSFDPSTKSELEALSINTGLDQGLLKNLYSYKYETSTEMPTIMAYIYHTAAKLDVQWDYSASSALPIVAPNNKVSVTNLTANGNIKLFDPLNNQAGTATLSTEINPGSMYMGRTVFYVPQLEADGAGKVNYNVGVGGAASAIPFVFKTPTDERYTTWFKANVTPAPAP